jgi:capsular exopolysaccharide synthesis family protein
MVDANVNDGQLGAAAPSVDLSSVIARARAHAPLVLIVLGIVMAADIAFTWTQKPRFTATATMSYAPKDVGITQGATPVQDDLARDQSVDTQVEAIKSPAVVDSVVSTLQLDKDPEFALSAKDLTLSAPLQRDALLDKVLRALKVKRVGQTLLVNVSYTDPSPTKAALIANAFADAFIKRQIEQKITSANTDNVLLNSQIDEMRQKVETAEAAVQSYKAAHNLVGSDTNGTALTEAAISQLDQQLATARMMEAEARGRLSAAQDQLKNGSHGEDVGAALGSPTVSQLRQQRAQISARVADLEGRYGPLHPDLQTAKHQLADIDAQIQAEVNRIISNLTAEVEVAQARTASLQGSVGSARSQLVQGDSASVTLAELQRNADAARELYETVLTRVKETAAQRAISQADSRVDSPATPPSTPSVPNKLLNLLLGVIAGLGLGAVAAFVVDRWNVRVNSIEDVEGQLNLPFLGSIPTLKSSIDKPKTNNPIEAVLLHPLSGFAEAFRGISTTLNYGETDAAVRIIAITSAVPEEGKTTTSICLTRVLALGGAKTVLVDCDLRRRSVNILSKSEPEIGLIEVLEGKATIDQALRFDEKSGAYFISLTHGAHMAKSPFSSPAMDKFLEDLKARFDIVILDTPPLLPVVDTRVLAQKVDALALLVRWQQTPIRAVRAAIHQLESVNAPITGIALTLVNMKAQSYAGYGYQTYYHKNFSKYYLE